MLQLIIFIIFVVSTSVVIFILSKKVSLVAQLPKSGTNNFKKNEFVLKIENKFKDTYFRLFSKRMLLLKFLSFARVIILKIERKIDESLRGIRKKAQQAEKNLKDKK